MEVDCEDVEVAEAVRARFRPGPPDNFQTDRQHLIAFDGSGKVVWRYHFHEPFVPALYPEKLGPYFVWTGNLDNDGANETLFSYKPANWISAGGTLFCFGQGGQVKWSYRPGRRVTDASGTAYKEFSAGPFLTFRRHPELEARVLVANAHTMQFPGQLAILNSSGQLISEYWHSGHLLRIALADLNGDGVEEVLAGGLNNGYGRAVLLVFDPRSMAGASTQPPGDPTQLQGFDPGTEKVLVRFPRSCVTELDEPFNRVNHLNVSDSSVEVNVAESHDESGPYLIYSFDRRLKPLRVTASDRFLKRHRELEGSGRLKHSFSDGEQEELLKQIEVIRK